MAPYAVQSDNHSSRAYSRLPKLDVLPQGFQEEYEAYSPQFDMSYVAVESLNEQPKAPQNTPEPATSNEGAGARQSTNEPLEVLSVTTKDAGIGDGSMYAYVEVANNSGETYPYIGLEGTCRDSSGGIVGHGLGNTANVAPDETVVVTMILLQVPGCTDVDVRFDALTGMI